MRLAALIWNGLIALRAIKTRASLSEPFEEWARGMSRRRGEVGA